MIIPSDSLDSELSPRITPLDSIITIATKDWAPAVAVFCEGLRKYATELAERIIIYRTEPLGSVELWASSRDSRVEFRPIESLGDVCAPWPTRSLRAPS